MRKLALKNATKLIYNSEYASLKSPFTHKTEILKNCFTEPQNINQSHNLEKLNIRSDSIVLLHIANIGKSKNIELLLKSWPLLKQKNGSLLGNMNHIISQMNQKSRCLFTIIFF